MKASILFQPPNAKKTATVEAAITRIASSKSWDSISVAVAYSSVSGVRRFYEIVRRNHSNVAFKWLLGLDDFITQPGAIEFCSTLPNSELRVTGSLGQNSRFHPKIYIFSATEKEKYSRALIGSANLTAAALSYNCEAVAEVEAEASADIAATEAVFASAWTLGSPLTSALFEDYSKKYQKYRKTRGFFLRAEPKEKKEKREILHSDAAEIDPSVANLCWIEVGKNTAMGRELEFKAEQALFFGLKPSGGSPEMRKFGVSDGEEVSLRLKYQGNAMWRLQMTREIPEVAVGLRPVRNGKLGRSPFVAVFERNANNDVINLTFVRSDSKDFSKIRSESLKLGTIGTTSAREYGWYRK